MLKGMILENSNFEKSQMKNRDLKQANYSDEITNMKSKFTDFGVKWRIFEVHWLMITFPPQNLGLTPLTSENSNSKVGELETCCSKLEEVEKRISCRVE